MTAASATSGCATARFSSSIEEIHSPPDLMMSSAVGDVHHSVRVDGDDISGVEESMLVENLVVSSKIRPGDGRPAHLEMSETGSIPWQIAAGIVREPELDAERRMTLLHLEIEKRLRSIAVIGLME